MAEVNFYFQSFPHYVDKKSKSHKFNILMKNGICGKPCNV